MEFNSYEAYLTLEKLGLKLEAFNNKDSKKNILTNLFIKYCTMIQFFRTGFKNLAKDTYNSITEEEKIIANFKLYIPKEIEGDESILQES